MAKKWIQKARKRMEKKGTVGSFTRYCGGKVTDECIRKALKSKNPKIRKKAAFAKAMRSIKRKELGGFLDEAYNSLTFADTNKYELGGALIDVGIEALTSLISAGIQKGKQTRQFASALNNTTEYEHGGSIEGRKDAFTYKGNSHAQGGIKVDLSGIPVLDSENEVEGDEVAVILDGKRYVFSKKLTI